jgi:hypothetical protein
MRAARISQTKPAISSFSTRAAMRMPDADPHDPHHEESFEEFTARYVHNLPHHHRLQWQKKHILAQKCSGNG